MVIQELFFLLISGFQKRFIPQPYQITMIHAEMFLNYNDWSLLLIYKLIHPKLTKIEKT